MGLIDSVKNFFVGDTVTTMNMGRQSELLRAPTNVIMNFYDNFHYPYSPMQRSKRYPKIINAYALQERANADVSGFLNHKLLIDDLETRLRHIEDVLPTIENNENYENGLKLIGKYLDYNLYRYVETRTGTAATSISIGWNTAFPQFTQKNIAYPLRISLIGMTNQNNLPYSLHGTLIRVGEGGGSKVDFNSPSNTTIIIKQIVFEFAAIN